MHGLVRGLLVFLIAAAFGIATLGTVTALTGDERPASTLGERAPLDPLVTGGGSGVYEFTHLRAPQHESHVKCIHPYCFSTTNATLAGVARLQVTMRVERGGFPIPDGKVLTGIAVAPLTGPPKLSA